MAAIGDLRRRMRRDACALAVVIVLAALSMPLAGCALHDKRTSATLDARAPSNVTVFMPERTRALQRDTGEVFAHQSPDFARRDGLIGVR